MPRTQKATSAEHPTTRILLVEDNIDLRDVTSILLRKAGYEVCAADSVENARKEVMRGSFDVLLSDVRLPDGSGLELMRELRSANPGLRGIALSGVNDVGAVLEAGFSAYLKKPFSFSDLSSTLRQILGARAVQLARSI